MKRILILALAALLTGCATHYSQQGLNALQSREYAAAYQNFESAAKQGDVNAFSYVGYMFEKGMGFRKNLDTARKHYELAAQKGSVHGLNNLGTLLWTHGVTRKEKELGVQYLTLAARWGNPNAIRGLKNIGRPVPSADLLQAQRRRNDENVGSMILMMNSLLQSYNQGRYGSP